MRFSAGARSGLLLVLLTAALTGAGCASRRNSELLEAQLRDREDELHQTRAELESVRTDLVATRREITQIHTQLAEGTSSPPAPETTHAIAQATGIRINAMQTGGLDQDEQPGDDVLHTVIEPLDGHGQVIAVPGELTVEVIDPSLPPEQRQVSRASWQPEEAARLWRAGLLTTGYQVQLPWRQPPGSKTVVLHVRLKTPDGRQFDSTETVSISPPGEPSPGGVASEQPDPVSQPVREVSPVTPNNPPVSRIMTSGNRQTSDPANTQPLVPAGFLKATAGEPPFRRIDESASPLATSTTADSDGSQPAVPPTEGARPEFDELFQLPRSR